MSENTPQIVDFQQSEKNGRESVFSTQDLYV